MLSRSTACILIPVLVAVLFFFGCTGQVPYQPLSGDVVFQISKSEQSRAIQLATGSRYSHVGIVFVRDGKAFVLEAVQPVKLTAFNTWVERGVDSHFVAKRILNSDNVITDYAVKRAESLADSMMGKKYDSYFEWSDDRLYCSELVWKLYKRTLNVELCPLRRLGDFNLTGPLVEKELKERYGAAVPLDEPVVAPSDLFDSDLLTQVYSN